MSKSILQIIYSCSVQKTALKNTKYSRNESILKIGHHTKAIAHAKSSLWLKKKNSKKHVKIHSTNHVQLFCAKNRSKKRQIFQKGDYFENRPSCKGYSPCKILTLAQKLKFQKTWQNPFYKSFTVVLRKKPLQKTKNFREIRAFSKSAIMQRLYPCKILTLEQKLKFQKTCQNPFYKSFTALLSKKPLLKTPNIREIKPFWKSAIMQRL